MSDKEEWRPVVGHEGYYEVSSHGGVRSIDRLVISSNGLERKLKGKRLKLKVRADGRFTVALRNREFRKVHQLVAAAFIGPKPEGLVVCHNDGDSKNNHFSNLRYDTRGENNRDAVKHGTHYQGKKKNCPRNHPLEKPNLAEHILREGRRSCLACSRTHGYVRAHPELKDRFKEISDRYFANLISN